MKAFFLLLLLVLSRLTTSAADTPRVTRTAEVVTRLNKSLDAYFLGRNIMDVALLYADDFKLSSDSSEQTKADLLRELANPSFWLEQNETTDVTVHVYGNTAVLTGTQHQRGHAYGRAFDRHLLVTNTWVRQRGSWRLLTSYVAAARPD